MGVRLALAGGAFTLLFLTALAAQTSTATVFLSYAQSAPVFAALDLPVPAASDWPEWIAAADAATRARVARGDEISIVNLLMFGTSFTSQPRLTSRQLDDGQITSALRMRLDDFERALARSDTNLRLQFARRLLAGGPIRPRLLAMIERAMNDSTLQARLIAEADALGDSSLQFAERSRLYRDRGLASDTSVRVNFAVEEALRRLTPVLTRGAVPGTRSIRRVGVIGPGLDVVDKQEGFDFYPPQTIQPFAIIDSLARLGLADAAGLELTTFDVSARVNDHIAELASQARAGAPYVMHVLLDGNVTWTRELLTYFSTFGAAVGDQLPVSIPPGVGPLRLRAVAVRPAIAGRIVARDLNITAQLLPLASDERFDLVVGTNVFLYYDRLQQGLAMAAIAAMLRPGGVLLSNNALVEVPSAGMKSIGYSKTLYSTRDEDGDLILWYQKGTN